MAATSLFALMQPIPKYQSSDTMSLPHSGLRGGASRLGDLNDVPPPTLKTGTAKAVAVFLSAMLNAACVRPQLRRYPSAQA